MFGMNEDSQRICNSFPKDIGKKEHSCQHFLTLYLQKDLTFLLFLVFFSFSCRISLKNYFHVFKFEKKMENLGQLKIVYLDFTNSFLGGYRSILVSSFKGFLQV